MANRAYSPKKCCCCAAKLGFAGVKWTQFMACCANWTAVENMKDNLSQLNDCRALFVGYQGNAGACGLPVELITDTSTLSTWINGGGRLYVCAEWKNFTD